MTFILGGRYLGGKCAYFLRFLLVNCTHKRRVLSALIASSHVEMSGVSRVRDLAEAVQCLDTQSSTSFLPVSPSQPGAGSSVSVSSSQPGPSGQSSFNTPSTLNSSHQFAGSGFRSGRSLAHVSSRASALAERNSLFNFTDRSKRKGTGLGSKPKKKMNHWLHEVICLSKTDCEKTPTAMERASLISSGEINAEAEMQRWHVKSVCVCVWGGGGGAQCP